MTSESVISIFSMSIFFITSPRRQRRRGDYNYHTRSLLIFQYFILGVGFFASIIIHIIIRCDFIRINLGKSSSVSVLITAAASIGAAHNALR